MEIFTNKVILIALLASIFVLFSKEMKKFYNNIRTSKSKLLWITFSYFIINPRSKYLPKIIEEASYFNNILIENSSILIKSCLFNKKNSKSNFSITIELNNKDIWKDVSIKKKNDKLSCICNLNESKININISDMKKGDYIHLEILIELKEFDEEKIGEFDINQIYRNISIYEDENITKKIHHVESLENEDNIKEYKILLIIIYFISIPIILHFFSQLINLVTGLQSEFIISLILAIFIGVLLRHNLSSFYQLKKRIKLQSKHIIKYDFRLKGKDIESKNYYKHEV
ncbi:MAG: hypothetical protein ACEPOW_14235 [Bacteroidales bacterium]